MGNRCECLACERNYPQYDQSLRAGIPDILTEEMIQRLRDQGYSRYLVHVLSKYLYDYADYYPCEELMFMENLYRVVLDIAYTDEMPLKVELIER